MPLPILGGTKVADTTFSVANSCRFNTGDSPYMYKTVVSPTSANISTISFWMKAIGVTDKGIFSARTDTNNRHSLYWEGGGGAKLELWGKKSGSANIEMHLTRALRDSSAWLHHCIAIDTTQATSTNRVKWYVNGVQQTAFDTATYPAENAVLEWSVANASLAVGAYAATSGFNYYFDGYLAEFVFIDGTAYAASDFGEFDEDSPTIWKPKDVSGLTFGNNGFYLDFEDSSNLGNDANGGTDLTESGLAAADQSVDSPSNNFCVVNPLDNYYAGATLSEGNCLVAHPAAKYNYITSTFGVSKGKWYFEGKLTVSGGTAATIGIAAEPTTSASDHLGGDAQGISIYQTSNGTFIRTGGSNTTLGDSDVVANDIIGVFIDLDNNKIYGSVNGTLETTTGISITAAASQTQGLYFPAMGDYDGGQAYTWAMNFGGCPSFALSSAVSDDNGYGNFEYTPTVTVDSAETKFYALCTKNLAEFG